jgi:hypothetical protein
MTAVASQRNLSISTEVGVSSGSTRSQGRLGPSSLWGHERPVPSKLCEGAEHRSVRLPPRISWRRQGLAILPGAAQTTCTHPSRRPRHRGCKGTGTPDRPAAGTRPGRRPWGAALLHVGSACRKTRGGAKRRKQLALQPQRQMWGQAEGKAPDSPSLKAMSLAGFRHVPPNSTS